MPSNVVRVRLEADSKDWERGFDKAQAKAVGFGSAVGTFAGNVAYDLGRKALGAVTDFVGESADAFSRLEQAVGGTEAVFGDASGSIDQFAQTSAESIGLSEAAFREATTGIGGQLKRMTGDVEFAAAQSIILTETAADLAATYGGTTEEAVRALGSAFRGEADPAERFNLDLKIGKVNAKALELGLAGSTSEIDDQARAQAILALIAEQSADAQGQFARESETAQGRTQRLTAAIEDQQAALGETAAEWELFWLQQKSNVAEGGAVLLNWFSAFSDDVTGAERDMRDFEIRTGATADTAAAAITIWKEYGTSLFELLPVMELNRDELGKLRDADEEWLLSIGFTREGIKKLDKAINDELLKSMPKASQEAHLLALNTDDVTEANEDAIPTVEELAEAEDEQAEATRRALQAQADMYDALRRVQDPLFNAFKTTQELTQAEKDLEDATRKYGEASDEAVEAASRVAGANATLEQILIDLKEDGIDPTGAAARHMLDGLGVPKPVIDRLFAQFDAMEANLEARLFGLNFSLPEFQYVRTGTNTFEPRKTTSTRIFGQHGGIAQAQQGGVDMTVAEAGSNEALIPLNGEGIKILGAALREAMSGVGSGINITVYAGWGTNGHDVGAQIVEEIEKARRRGVAV